MIKRLDRKATLVRLDTGQPSNVSAPARPLYDHARSAARLDADPVPPTNPYWAAHRLTFEDPDGFRVVLVPECWEIRRGRRDAYSA